MIAQPFVMLIVPVCAVAAGAVVWVIGQGQSLSDDVLVKHFLVALAMSGMVLFGVCRTTAVRVRIDPEFRLQTELEAHPVYATIKRLDASDLEELKAALQERIAAGYSLNDAFLQVRPFLTRLARERIAFADQKTHLEWARMHVDTLRVLQARDPILCYRMMSTGEMSREVLATAFTAEDSTAFQQAFLDVYESAHAYFDKVKRSDQHSSLHEMQLEYSAINEALTSTYGEQVARQLSRSQFPVMAGGEPQRSSAGASGASADGRSTQAILCEARIAQFDAVLARPQPIASSIVDTLLR